MGKKYLLPVVGIIVAGLVVYTFAFRSEPAPTGAFGPMGGGPGLAPTVVTVTNVEQGGFSRRTEFVGTLRGIAQAELYAKTSGPILEVYAETGDYVRAGQVLAQIDDAEAREGVRQAEAALKMAEATVAQREAALHVARMNAERSKTLREKALVSEQDDDAVQADLLSAEAQLKLAQAQVEQAVANLSRAQLQLENTRVVAPYNGYIGKRFLDKGAFAATNRPVFSIVDVSTIKLSVSLVDRDAVHIAPGQEATITTNALPGRTFVGKVARISPVFDPASGMTEAEVEIQNHDGLLKPGMLVRVEIAQDSEPSALLVPVSAVVETATGTHLFVAEQGEAESWKAKQVPVRVIGQGEGDRKDLVAVEGMLAVGDQVVTLGHEALRDGATIRLAGVDMAQQGKAPDASKSL
jgi:RND family efflux transporter MFP subunit